MSCHTFLILIWQTIVLTSCIFSICKEIEGEGKTFYELSNLLLPDNKQNDDDRVVGFREILQ